MPWAIGEGWRSCFTKFLHLCDQFWHRMNYRSFVDRSECEQVYRILLPLIEFLHISDLWRSTITRYFSRISLFSHAKALFSTYTVPLCRPRGLILCGYNVCTCVTYMSCRWQHRVESMPPWWMSNRTFWTKPGVESRPVYRGWQRRSLKTTPR